jgi:hypothetical protein
MNWRAPHALQVLFSPAHGFFVWTPLAVVALAGIVFLVRSPGASADSVASAAGQKISPTDPVASAVPGLSKVEGRRKKQVGICLLVMLALQIYIGGSVESWTVAGAFGQRRFIALTCAMVIGYAAAEAGVRAWSRNARRACAAITVLAVYWNLALIAEFATGLMDRQRLEPARNAYDAVVTLPRMAPSLAYRYLFERPSFYKRGS